MKEINGREQIRNERNVWNSLGFLLEVYRILEKRLKHLLKERFQKFDEIAEYNQMKVLWQCRKQSQCRLLSVFQGMAMMISVVTPWKKCDADTFHTEVLPDPFADYLR